MAVEEEFQPTVSPSGEGLEHLFEELYDELRQIAHRQLSRHSGSDAGSGAGDRALSTSTLVHSLYLRLFQARRITVESRGHFLALAARAMRMILVDAARERSAEKRGGREIRVDLPLDLADSALLAEDLLGLDRALDRLGHLDARLAKVVELRYFGGLTEDETAEALGVNARTVRRDWRTARAFLRRQIGGGAE